MALLNPFYRYWILNGLTLRIEESQIPLREPTVFLKKRFQLFPPLCERIETLCECL